MMASNECFCIDASSLAGWPSLRIFTLHCANLSTKLSTATLEGAQHRTCTGVNTILQLVCNESYKYLENVFTLNLTHFLALLDHLQDEFHHCGGFTSPWWSMNYSQLSLGQSKCHSFSLGLIKVLVEEFNFI